MTNFLDVQDVIRIHKIVIQETGGGSGLRDLGLLESAVAQPRASFGGVQLFQSLEEMAAALCFSIVSNHPFVDGNKRTGFVAADTMLRLNGFAITTDQKQGEETILQLAAGKLTKEQLTAWFKANMHAIKETNS